MSKSGNMKILSFLAITLWTIIGLSCSLASMIAFDVGNRMIYRLTGFDQIYINYGQTSANVAQHEIFMIIFSHSQSWNARLARITCRNANMMRNALSTREEVGVGFLQSIISFFIHLDRIIFKNCGKQCHRTSIVTTCEVCKEDDKECNEKGVQCNYCLFWIR